MTKMYIGTSGWHYKHWCEVFYPPDLGPADWLDFYAMQFDCVEINNSFYRFPSRENIGAWLDCTPLGFRFALKANRYITHQKKLKDCAQALKRFLVQAQNLGDKLGPVLFQLPPRWRVNCERLATFLRLLPAEMRFVMEFRDQSWHCAEVWDLLARHGVAWCQYDLQGFLATETITAQWVYLRLHGPGADAYCGSYSETELQQWSSRITGWQQAGYQVWVFFDNDEAGYAPANAKRLLQLCENPA